MKLHQLAMHNHIIEVFEKVRLFARLSLKVFS